MEQNGFDGINCAVTQENVLAYLDLSQHFDIHTDANDYQVGAVIIQEGKSWLSTDKNRQERKSNT